MSENDSHRDAGGPDGPEYDAVVVGAGFSGLYLLHRLRDQMGLSVKVLEKADDVGGTWYWNRYPGARCDSESHVYCYSFNDELLEEWEWSERYPEQPEVLEYLRFVADYLDLRRDIDFEREVTSATFDETTGTWEIGTDDGGRLTSQFFVTAVGCLSKPFIPNFEGVESFEGDWYHTGKWPHDPVDFEGKRVAVIGTGATGIQVIPEVAKKDVDHLTVFQRTPNYAVPARNRPLGDDDWEEIQQNYDEILEKAHDSGFGHPFEIGYETAEDLSMEEVEELLEPRWEEGGFRLMLTFGDLIANPNTNEKVSQFIRDKIRETVDDPELADKLVPTDHYYATKRPPLHTDFYKTFNREDVSLVDVTETPIKRITPKGVRTSESDHEFDIIIYATGFDAMTGTLLQMDIRGREGLTLEEKWAEGPKTYLGLAIHGFPNMFTITGPQSPSVLSNMPVSIEHHVEWVSDTIEHLVAEGVQLTEPTKEAEDAWTVHNREVGESTLYTEAESWYMGDNVPGKPRVFTPYVGGVDVYRDTITEVAEKDYEGFELTESVQNLGRKGEQPKLSVMEGD
ncbi:flavin-containing monooxygenase [Natrialbaceae archaeon GCM10025810]|uniref:flavin-containing monooxygenase n=1 Tax=Halovalidus salilacus TaxID=3075124 RepID=UPI003623B5DF